VGGVEELRSREVEVSSSLLPLRLFELPQRIIVGVEESRSQGLGGSREVEELRSRGVEESRSGEVEEWRS
jgi:hypothetical protein